jgi:hypothetical protein
MKEVVIPLGVTEETMVPDVPEEVAAAARTEATP